MATVGQAAAHIFLTDRIFLQLVDKGVIERAARGEYDLDRVRESYILHMRARAAGRDKPALAADELDATQEMARKNKELADRTALQNAVTRGELFSGVAVSRLVIEAFSKVRTRLLSIPTKLAPTVVHLETIPEVQARLAEGINDALGELSEQAVLRAAGAESAGLVDDGDLNPLIDEALIDDSGRIDQRIEPNVARRRGRPPGSGVGRQSRARQADV